ncbi:MAG: hypothetical protein WC861_06025 [Candidatus Micrarchaeia archaeon]|jgi:hypothetical protein
MMIFQGFGAGQVGKKAADAPTLAVIRREYAETYSALQRIGDALAKGDIKEAQAASKGLTKWAVETTKAVSSNTQLMHRIAGLEYNLDRLVPGTDANLSFVKEIGELNAERKKEVLGYVADGLSYAKENALKAGSLSCLGEALNIKDAKISGEMFSIMAGAQSPEDYLRIFDPKAKAASSTDFFASDIEFRNRKAMKISVPEKEQAGPRFPEGSPLAQVEEKVKNGDFEGARKIVEGKYLELATPPAIARLEIKRITEVDEEATLWGVARKGGELVVPLWGATESGIRAYDDFGSGQYVLGAVNSVSALLQLGMDAAAIISIGRLSRLSTAGKQAIRGLARMAENEFEKTVSKSVEKEVQKELTKGIAKKTFEKLEDKQIAGVYENTLKATKQAIETAGRGNVTKGTLRKIAKEQAVKEVDVTIRNTPENIAALGAEKLMKTGTKAGMADRASKILRTAKERTWAAIESPGNRLSLGSREAAAQNMRNRAAALREDGKQLMTESYILPYLAKTEYKPWKMFIWTGKHANGLTARTLERQAWALEASVTAQNWATRKLLGAKDAITPYFRNTPPTGLLKSNAYWWARTTNIVGMAATELPGSFADPKDILQRGMSATDIFLNSRISRKAAPKYTYKADVQRSGNSLTVTLTDKTGVLYEGQDLTIYRKEAGKGEVSAGAGYSHGLNDPIVISPPNGANVTFRVIDANNAEIARFKGK